MQDTNQRISVRNIILIFCIILFVFLLAFTFLANERIVYYNCRDIDFLPDVPPSVREACNDLIKERLKEENINEKKFKLKV